MKRVAAAVVGLIVLVLAAFAFQGFWDQAHNCPPVRQLELRLTAAYGNATTPWLELNDTDLAQNQVLRAMFDAWYGNSSDPRVSGSKTTYGVDWGGSPADLQTVDDFLQSHGRTHGAVPIRYDGDSFLLRDQWIVC